MSHPNKYDKGDVVRATGSFTGGGAAIDPDSVSFRVKAPDGTVTVYVYLTDAELVKEATGVYHVDVDANANGEWFYRWESSGLGQAAAEGRFIVKASAFP